MALALGFCAELHGVANGHSPPATRASYWKRSRGTAGGAFREPSEGTK